MCDHSLQSGLESHFLASLGMNFTHSDIEHPVGGGWTGVSMSTQHTSSTLGGGRRAVGSCRSYTPA